MAKHTIQIEIEATSAFEAKDTETLLKKIAALPSEDRDRLSQIISPKALKALKDSWSFVKNMLA